MQLETGRNGDLRKLMKILRQVGPENIWRPVYAPGNILLSEGIGDIRDGLPENLWKFNFKDKTVADLGCNFGYYTFMVKKAGASHVLGIDKDRRIIRGCRILKRLFHADGISFLVADIMDSRAIGTFDTGMMIDFIGKTMVTTGIFKEYLNALERVSEKNMILSLRSVYNVKKHLRNDFHGLAEKYPGDYIRKDSFFTIDYVREYFSSRWEMEIVFPERGQVDSEKHLFYFTRKKGKSMERILPSNSSNRQ